jgi:peptidoglycan/LPS O-acetylase OafA/YrhL
MKVKLSYIPELDGIRALAAFLVMLTHWPNVLLSLKFGWIGVNIFFVLSGFLITRILVAEKEQSLKSYLQQFYFKRSLRIFPLYYAFILLGLILFLLVSSWFPSLLAIESYKSGYDTITKDFAWYFAYAYNIKINLRYFFEWNDSSNHFFGHLWSLAVEEQFYLIFPFIVYFASLKNLKRVILGLIIICPLLRLWAALYGHTLVTDSYWFGELFYSNTLLQADALAWGAAITLFDFKFKKHYLNFVLVFAIWLLVGLTCLFFLRKAGYFLVEGKSLGYNFPGFWYQQFTPYWFINIRPFYQSILVNVLAVALILPATQNKPLFAKIFNFPIVSYFGKISYGIYLFHNPIMALFVIAGGYLGGWYLFTANPVIEIFVFIIYFLVVFGVAHLSYQYFEKIFLKFKNNPKYSKPFLN